MYPEGIRHIRADKRVNEWKSPGKRAILKCALNDHQVVIALTGGELVYFEMDLVRKQHTLSLPSSHTHVSLCLLSPLSPSLSSQSGQLNEYTERKEMLADVVCMSLGSVPLGEQRSRFLSVGLSDQTVRIISLDPSVRVQSSNYEMSHDYHMTYIYTRTHYSH